MKWVRAFVNVTAVFILPICLFLDISVGVISGTVNVLWFIGKVAQFLIFLPAYAFTPYQMWNIINGIARATPIQIVHHVTHQEDTDFNSSVYLEAYATRKEFEIFRSAANASGLWVSGVRRPERNNYFFVRLGSTDKFIYFLRIVNHDANRNQQQITGE